MHITIIQALLIGIVSIFGASNMASLGTTPGNYTLARPLIGAFIVGLILNDVRYCIMIAVPVQILYIAVITPGGIAYVDLKSVSYIGIPLAYAVNKAFDLPADSLTAQSFTVIICGFVGAIGVFLFNSTARMNLIWQHRTWNDLDKGNTKALGTASVLYPFISNFLLSFIPVFICSYLLCNVILSGNTQLPEHSLLLSIIVQAGAMLPIIGIVILLNSVIDKPIDLIYFCAGFTFTASTGMSLLSATAIGGMFALIHYTIKMRQSK